MSETTTDAVPTPFEIAVTHPDGAVTVVSVRGELDMITAPLLSDSVDAVLHEAPAVTLIVDLSEVSFLASAGINVLIDTYERTSGRKSFAVVANGPRTRRPLIILGLDRTFAIHADLADALTALRTEQT